MTNIFIALSQNHIDLIQNLIIQLEIIEQNNILITSKNIKYDSSFFNKVICSKDSFDSKSKNKLNRIINIFKKIKNYRVIVSQLQEYKDKDNVKLFFTYIEDVLTNYLLLSFNKKIKGIVFEDGILNYYYHDISKISKVNLILKKIISLLFGLKFIFYKGHSSGIEYNHVMCQYVRVPHKSVFSEKSKKINLNQIKIDKLNNHILIIGQEPFQNIIGEKAFYEKFDKMLNTIKQLDNYTKLSKIYYKPHRHGLRIKTNYIESFLDKEVVFMDGNYTVENLFFDNLQSKYVFTFNSSAVLNIYLSLSEEFQELISLNVFLDKEDVLVNLYNDLNINIIY